MKSFYKMAQYSERETHAIEMNIICNSNLDYYKKMNLMTKMYYDNKHKGFLWLKKKISTFFRSLCRNNYYDGIKDLVNMFPFLNPYSKRDYAFRIACINGNLNIMNYLCGTFHKINHDNKNGNAFRMACQNGHLDVIKWFCDQPFSEINLQCYYVEAIYIACDKGYYEIVKYLIEKSSNTNCHISTNKLFKSIFKNHYSDIKVHNCDDIDERIKIMKYLLEKFPEINPHIGNELAFRSLCNHGELEEVQYFVENVDNINCHVNDEEVFTNACEDGNLELAKYLKKIYPDINHYRLNKPRCPMMKEIVEWLKADCPIPRKMIKSAFSNE